MHSVTNKYTRILQDSSSIQENPGTFYQNSCRICYAQCDKQIYQNPAGFQQYLRKSWNFLSGFLQDLKRTVWQTNIPESCRIPAVFKRILELSIRIPAGFEAYNIQ
jgi:hypothetical protein